jgi:hypothetical protein
MKTNKRSGDHAKEPYTVLASEGPSVSEVASRRVEARRLFLRLLAGYALTRNADDSGAQKVA